MFSLFEFLFASKERVEFFKAAEKGDTETIDRYFKQPPQILAKWDVSLSSAYGIHEGYSLEHTILGVALNNKNTSTIIYILDNIDKFLVNCPLKQVDIINYVFRKATTTDNIHLFNYLLSNNNIPCYKSLELLMCEAIQCGALAVIDRLLEVPHINLAKELIVETRELDDPEYSSYTITEHKFTLSQLAHKLGYHDLAEKIKTKIQHSEATRPTPSTSPWSSLFTEQEVEFRRTSNKTLALKPQTDENHPEVSSTRGTSIFQVLSPTSSIKDQRPMEEATNNLTSTVS